MRAGSNASALRMDGCQWHYATYNSTTWYHQLVLVLPVVLVLGPLVLVLAITG